MYICMSSCLNLILGLYLHNHNKCYITPTCCSFKAQLEKIAGLEREKQQMRDRSYSLEAQLVLKGRAVKEAEGRIEETELKQKKVCTFTCTVLEVLRVCSTVHDSKQKFGL